MTRFFSLLLVAASLVLFAPSAFAASDASTGASSPSDVIATVNGQPITRQDLDFAKAEVGVQLANIPPSKRDQMLLQFIIENDLMAQAAEKEHLNKAPDFKARLAYHRLRALRDAFFAKNIMGAVSAAEAKKIYDSRIKTLKGREQIHVRHILVKTKAEAEAIRKELENGANFAKLANEKSEDKSSNGGDLGYFSRGQMVKPFEDAAFKLKVGQISEPVHTQFGWHIIEVLGKRKEPVPSFAAVKDAIMAKLMENKTALTVNQLEDSAKIKILDPKIKQQMQDSVMDQMQKGAPGQGQAAKPAQ